MDYIVLDMEWNQPYPGEKLIYKNDYCITNEVIQIGAVKIDDSYAITETFSINIKPTVFKKLNHNVKKLTGIEQSTLNESVTIDEAIAVFKEWCGKDFVFFSWGYDDIRVLRNNLKYLELDTDWLPECYNLQMIFCAQTDNENRQYSLSHAMEHFSITPDKPFHNALTDAYYTALVALKLNIKKGISEYRAMVFKDKSIPEHMKNIIYKRNYPSYPSYERIVKRCRLDAPICCDCCAELDVIKRVSNGAFHHLVMGRCAEHGTYAIVYKIYKNGDNAFNATEQCFFVDKYNEGYFNVLANKMLASNEKRIKSSVIRRKKEFRKSSTIMGKIINNV